MSYRTLVLITAALCFTGISGFGETKAVAPASNGSPYLFVWAGDAAHQSTDFLAVIDANPSSPSYGRIVSSLPVGAASTMPHHTEYEFPQGNMLFANGWVAGRTFIFDLSQPLKPRIAEQFQDRAGYSFPHSFVRLPNGHLLGTFQSHGEGYAPGGGLVELDANGSAVRSASAVDPALDKDLIWPYSLTVAPEIDRAVSSSTPMGWPEWAKLPPGSWPFKKINDQVTSQVQIWRLSDLQLLNTVTLPPDSTGKHNFYPAEPRVLADGSIYVNTFRCGLYRMKDVSGARPSAELVYTFPGGDTDHTLCAVPVVVGHYWIQTVGALPGLIVLDVSHPERPVEVSRLVIDGRFEMPHWLAADRRSNRLVVTGDDQSWVLVARFDPDKGTLSLDPTFREPGATEPGISFDREQWPHGKAGRAVVHGALFGPQ
jgi:56kDa selenium binding protein (SBP56)